MGKFDFYDREHRPWPNERLSRASIVGHTTATRTTLWFRAKQPGHYYVFLSEEPIDADGVPTLEGNVLTVMSADGGWAYPGKPSHRQSVGFETDCTWAVDFTGLSEDTQYYYVVFSAEERAEKKPPWNWWEVGFEVPLSFRTMPRRPHRVAFGLLSCHKPYDKRKNLVHLDLWRRLGEQLLESDARFLIAAGDQVYSDGHGDLNIWKWLKKVKDEDGFPEDRNEQVELMKSWYRDIYRGYWGQPEVREVLRRFPSYMIWDDHEIVDGWGSYEQDELEKLLNKWNVIDSRDRVPRKLQMIESMFEAAKRVYLEYEHSHNPRTPAGEYDYAFRHGPCAFYVLDGRGHRDYTLPGHPVLGEEQHARFSTWLSQRREKVLFIVSAVPMVHVSSFVVNKLDIPWIGLADDLRDEWEHESHWEERDRLLDQIFEHSENRGSKVIFLSGDVHVGAAFRLWRSSQADARVYQFTSSAITWASTPGEILKLVVRDEGFLAGPENATNRTQFQNLHIAEENNFGIIDVRAESSGAPEVRWTLYQDAHHEDRITKLRTIVV